MMGLQKVASLIAGVSAAALAVVQVSAAVPAPAAVPAAAADVGLLPTGVDAAIRRAAAAAPVTAPAPAPQRKGQLSGGNGEAGSLCIVKFSAPVLLATWNGGSAAGFFQSKLICSDTVGTSEVLIEQNDQLVVAGTVVNNQTNLTLFSTTVNLNEEQQDTFCTAVARENSAGAFSVAGQECFHPGGLGAGGAYGHAKGAGYGAAAAKHGHR